MSERLLNLIKNNKRLSTHKPCFYLLFSFTQRVYDEEVEDPGPKPETMERPPEQVLFGDVSLAISAVDR